MLVDLPFRSVLLANECQQPLRLVAVAQLLSDAEEHLVLRIQLGLEGLPVALAEAVRGAAAR